jgi:hypothetical protein
MSELAYDFYQAIKNNSKCMVCGSPDHLNFHHVTPADKVTEIIKIIRMGDLPGSVAELQKTIPVCEDDHRRIHKGQLKGWLNGQFNSGQPSTAEHAKQYMPYVNWFVRKRPWVVMQFCVDNIDRNRAGLGLIFNACGIALPEHLRLSLASVSGTPDRSEHGSTVIQLPLFPRTSDRRNPTGSHPRAAA